MAHNEADFVCPICFSSDCSAGFGTLDCCQHIFCFHCIHIWLESCSKCPVCKRDAHRLHRHQVSASPALESDEAVEHVHELLNSPSTIVESIDVEQRQLAQADPDMPDTESTTDLRHSELCEVCGINRDAHLCLQCDSCNRTFHTYCINLCHVPAGQWYCPDCDVFGEGRTIQHQVPTALPSRHAAPVSHLNRTCRGSAVSLTRRLPRVQARCSGTKRIAQNTFTEYAYNAYTAYHSNRI